MTDVRRGFNLKNILKISIKFEEGLRVTKVTNYLWQIMFFVRIVTKSQIPFIIAFHS